MKGFEESRLTSRERWGIFLFYALLSLIYLIPALKGVPAGDGYGNYHGFWWFKKALLSFRNPFYSDYFYFPQGANLAFYGGASFSSFLLTLPVSLLAGIHPAVLTGHFLGYLLSAYFTFLLAFDLTGSKGGSFVSGIIFAFAPYHFSNVPIAMILSSLQWLPLFFWTFKRALDTQQLKWSLLAGTSLSLVVLADQMQAIMVALVLLVMVPLLLIHLSRGAKSDSGLPVPTFGKTLFILSVVGFTALLLASPYLYAFYDFMSSSSDNLIVDHFDRRGANRFSADLIAFIVPPNYNPLLGKLMAGIAAVTGNELFLGYTAMVLAAVGLWGNRRQGRVIFIALITMLALVLSLGPTLHVNGVWERSGGIIKLPYYFTKDWPILGNIRTPYRFHPLTMLGIALLAAYGVSRLKQLLGASPWINRLTAGLACCVMLEFLPGPTKYDVAVKVPAIVYAMARDKEDYSVLQLPLSRWDALRRNGVGSPGVSIYFQSIHGKRIFSGHMSRAQNSSLEFRDPVLEAMKEVSDYETSGVVISEKRHATAAEAEEARGIARRLAGMKDDFMRTNRVSYILVHYPVAYKGSMTRAFIEEFTGMPLVDVPEDAVAYVKVP